MAKPPPATPNSDITGVNRDMRVDSQPVRHNPDQMEELKQRSDEDRARPPRHSRPEGEQKER